MPSQVTNVASDDALTAIYRISHDEEDVVIAARLAERLEVTAPTMSAMLRRLSRDAQIQFDNRKRITLTEQGLRRARQMIRRHRLAECLLVDILGLEWWRAYEEAHLLEHALSPQTEQLLCARLGHPPRSPFGFPIPGCADPTLTSHRTLADMALSSAATVDRVFEEDQELLQLFDRAEIRPGARIDLREHSRAAGIITSTVSAGGGEPREVTLGLGAARRIWVVTHP